MTILLPCASCMVMAPDRPHLAEPAETVVTLRCPECSAAIDLAVCPLHEVELRVDQAEGVLHCPDCHGHPRHACVAVDLVGATGHLG